MFLITSGICKIQLQSFERGHLYLHVRIWIFVYTMFLLLGEGDL